MIEFNKPPFIGTELEYIRQEMCIRDSIFLGAAGLFSFLLSGYGFYVGMKSFKEEQVSHRMSVLGSITSGGMLVAWLALFLIGVR